MFLVLNINCLCILLFKKWDFENKKALPYIH